MNLHVIRQIRICFADILVHCMRQCYPVRFNLKRYSGIVKVNILPVPRVS